VGRPELGLNSLWKIKFNNELATYNNTSITLQYIKSNKFLGRYYCNNSYYDNNGNYLYGYCYHKSPLTNHTEGKFCLLKQHKYLLLLNIIIF
jgi:hypothetical protein